MFFYQLLVLTYNLLNFKFKSIIIHFNYGKISTQEIKQLRLDVDHRERILRRHPENYGNGTRIGLEKK